MWPPGADALAAAYKKVDDELEQLLEGEEGYCAPGMPEAEAVQRIKRLESEVDGLERQLCVLCRGDTTGLFLRTCKMRDNGKLWLTHEDGKATRLSPLVRFDGEAREKKAHVVYQCQTGKTAVLPIQWADSIVATTRAISAALPPLRKGHHLRWLVQGASLSVEHECAQWRIGRETLSESAAAARTVASIMDVGLSSTEPVLIQVASHR